MRLGHAILAIIGCLIPSAPNMPARSEPTASPMPSERQIGAIYDELARRTGTLTEAAELSPDGRYVVVEIGQQLRVYLVDGTFLLDLGEGLKPRWSPDSRTIAFFSNRSGNLQIWSWSPGRSVRQLTSLEGGVDPDPTARFGGLAAEALAINWSPDSASIVFATRKTSRNADFDPAAPVVLGNTAPAELVLRGVFSEASYESGVVQLDGGRTYGFRNLVPGTSIAHDLVILHLRSGQTNHIHADGYALFTPSWSPDGRVIVSGRIARPAQVDRIEAMAMAQGPNAGGDIVGFSPAGELVFVAAAGRDIKYQPRIGPDGRRLYYLAGDVFGTSRELRSERLGRPGHRIHMGGQSIIDFVLDGRGVPVARARSGPDLITETGGRTITLVRSVGFTGWSRSARGATVWRDSAAVHIRDPGLATSRPVLNLTPTATPPTIVDGPVEQINWRNRRGETLTGWILFPPGHRPGQRHPLIVDAYPQIGGSGWIHPLGGNQGWANLGFAVFRPSARAPIAWMNAHPVNGAAFSALAKGPGGWAITEDDVFSGLDELERRGLADPDRICIHGHSNGGGVAAYLLTRPRRFACAVVVAPALIDWVRRALLPTDGRSYLRTWSGGVDIDADVNAYIELSPVFRMHNVTIPTLIAAGDKDGNFLLDAIEMYNGIRAAGTDVTLIRYPGQGHVFTGSAMRDFYIREARFLIDHLRPTPASEP